MKATVVIRDFMPQTVEGENLAEIRSKIPEMCASVIKTLAEEGLFNYTRTACIWRISGITELGSEPDLSGYLRGEVYVTIVRDGSKVITRGTAL